jgi:hypothetical protein
MPNRQTPRQSTGLEPPSRIGELISWLTAAGKDDVRYLVREHPN